MTKTIPKRKKYKKANWLSEEVLRIAEKEEKRKAKEKGKDTQLSSREEQGEIRNPS